MAIRPLFSSPGRAWRAARWIALALPVAFGTASGCSCDEGLTQLNSVVEVEPMVLDFGKVALNTTKTLPLKVTNKGMIRLDIEGITTETPFVMPQVTTATIGSLKSVELQVGFAPTALGPFEGSLVMMTDDPDAPTVTVPLMGEGIEAAINVDPNMIDFGEILWSATTEMETQIVTVSNPGTDAFDLTDLVLSEDANGAFTIDPMDAVKTYGPQDSGAFAVSYFPNVMGSVTGMVRFMTTTRQAPEVTIPLAAKAVGPIMELCTNVGATELCSQNGDTPGINYGLIGRMESQTAQLRILNVGDRDLTINALQTVRMEEEITFNPGLMGLAGTMIGPGSEQQIDVTYTPEDFLADSEFLSISSNSTFDPQASIRIEGGVRQATIEVVPRGLTFTLTDQAQRSQVSVRIYNCGTEVLTLANAPTINQTSGPTQALSIANVPAAGAMLPPQSCDPTPQDPPGAQFDVIFETTTSGFYSAEIQIASNDPTEPMVTVTIDATRN